MPAPSYACPSCVGSPLPPYSHLDPDTSTRGLIPDKEAARSVLHHLLGLDPYDPPPRVEAGSARLAEEEAEMRNMLEAKRLPRPLEKKLRERVGNLRRSKSRFRKRTT